MQENKQRTAGGNDQAELELLENAARQAARIALGFFGRDPDTWLKGNKSPVSEADLAVDRHLAAVLRGERPEYGWLSEETADDKSRMSSERTFIVDPIDGTRAFLAGGDEWTIALAVVERGRPVAGAVFCPVRDEMYLARQSGGAWCNGKPIAVSGCSSVNGARLSGPPSVAQNKDLQAIGLEPADIMRSLAYRFAIVAGGQVDLAVARGGPCDWDLAAADVLVQEAGGSVTDLSGNLPLYNRASIRHPALIAAPKDLAGPARAAIRDFVN